MTEEVLQEWLSEYQSLDPTQLRSFAAEQEHNTDVMLGIFTLFEERNKYPQLVDPICSQLFDFYRTREVELQRFTLQFIPVLIRLYLGCVAHGDKRSCRSIETLLIGIYNLEIVDENGQPKVISFRLPSIAQSSIYHEPISLGPSFLTTNVLRRLEECNSKLVSWGPLQQVEALNAQNRLNVMTALMFLFNRHLSRINHKITLEYLCKSILKLVTQGFYRPGHAQRSSYGSNDSTSSNNIRSGSQPPRVPLSSQFLLELLHALYYAAFNGQEYLANQSIESIHQRACYESFVDVQLLANAIKHSLRLSVTSERPMGISMAIGTTTNTPTVSKSMITNASFRIKKLPDDLEDELVANLMANSTHDGTKHNLHKEMFNKKLNNHYQHNKNKKKSKQLYRIEPDMSRTPSSTNKTSPSTRHVKSCDNSPKHSPSKKLSIQQQCNSSTSSLITSPSAGGVVKIREKSKSSKQMNRSSADARLFCQQFHTEDDDDILQSYIVSGRPAKDIPIQNKDEANADGKNLVSITEEHEDDVVTANAPEKIKTSKQIKDAVPKSLPKLPTFSGLGKKLNKDKEQKQNDKTNVTSSSTVALSPGDSGDNNPTKKVITQKDGVTKGNRNSITLTDGVLNDITSKKSTSSLNNNSNGSIIVLDSKNIEITTEKVSLVSDSLQEDTSQSVSHDDDSASIILDEHHNVESSAMIPLMTLQENDLKPSMQVSSV